MQKKWSWVIVYSNWSQDQFLKIGPLVEEDGPRSHGFCVGPIGWRLTCVHEAGLLTKTTGSVPRIILKARRGRNEAIRCGMARKRTEPEKLNGCFANVRNLEQAPDCWEERRSGGDIRRWGARASFQLHGLLALSLCLPSALCTSFLGIIPLGLEVGLCPLLFRDMASFLLPEGWGLSYPACLCSSCPLLCWPQLLPETCYFFVGVHLLVCLNSIQSHCFFV